MNSSDTEILRLKNNPYPGRGIVIGLSGDGLRWYQIYWIMGRSLQSKNRVFIEENDILYTKVYDERLTLNPELLIYPAMKQAKDKHIVTNGSHTDIIEEYLKKDKTLYEAMLQITYEPDSPHFTPRIAGIIDIGNNTFSMVIFKKYSADSNGCLKTLFSYESPPKGKGYCIHTYNNDGNPLPSFQGEPFQVPLFNSIEENLNFYWDILDEENKVSLAVKEISIDSQISKIKIINKNN